MNGGLYLCENNGFAGHCVHYTTEFGKCGMLKQFIAAQDNVHLHRVVVAGLTCI